MPIIVKDITINWTIESVKDKIREQLPASFQDVDIIL